MNQAELEQLKNEFKAKFKKDYTEDLSAFISYCNLVSLESLKGIILDMQKTINNLSNKNLN